ncbi:HNH endonuclease [Grimontia celer]|uniref:HNH endonuclease n=1 Tax=Grimontia celer TaxID=1796497 RepID=A0A128ET99_9GAMM|nr:HNH endonuclease signature motif containing protein [Grimontia celer]CZF77186.1 HNH endonuclease [Grimontia celer]
MSIEKARQFIIDTVLEPKADPRTIPQEFKRKAASQLPWVKNFKKVGDLYKYLISVTKNADKTVKAAEHAGFTSYEQALPEFERLFHDQLSDRTEFEEFIEGETYSAFDILSVVGVYDARTGGILRQKEGELLKSIAIRATLEGDEYKNEWLIENDLLKYYMKSIGGVYKETYSDNAAIIKSGAAGIPIHAFVRTSKTGHFTYHGVFEYITHYHEGSAKWFRLQKVTSTKSELEFLDDITSTLERDVQSSSADSAETRRKRLAKAARTPRSRVVKTVVYERNPDVVVEVLSRAKGTCEKCLKPAPFIKKSNGAPYLEVHHQVRLADGGEDTVDNAIALCPNCHRQAHFGVQFSS